MAVAISPLSVVIFTVKLLFQFQLPFHSYFSFGLFLLGVSFQVDYSRAIVFLFFLFLILFFTRLEVFKISVHVFIVLVVHFEEFLGILPCRPLASDKTVFYKITNLLLLPILEFGNTEQTTVDSISILGGL